MKQSEKIHTEISKIAEDLKCSFFDAVLEFCESNQIDPEDVVKQMDDITKERVKKSSIDDYRAGINDLYDEIDKVNTTQIQLVEIYDNKTESVEPYFILEGNTFSPKENKPVNIPVLLKAEK